MKWLHSKQFSSNHHTATEHIFRLVLTQNNCQPWCTGSSSSGLRTDLHTVQILCNGLYQLPW